MDEERQQRLLLSFGAPPEFVGCRARGVRLWRGVSFGTDKDLWFGCGWTSEVRRSKYMAPAVSVRIDEYFLARFGWRARSNNVLFVTGDYSEASRYGHPVEVAPISTMKVVWSEKVKNLSKLVMLEFGDEEPTDLVLTQWLDSLGYQSGSLACAARSGAEIMLHARRYLWGDFSRLFIAAPPDLENDDLAQVVFNGRIDDGKMLRIEAWSWDGMKCGSAVFLSEEVLTVADGDLIAVAKGRVDYIDDSSVKVSRDTLFVYVSWAVLLPKPLLVQLPRAQ